MLFMRVFGSDWIVCLMALKEARHTHILIIVVAVIVNLLRSCSLYSNINVTLCIVLILYYKKDLQHLASPEMFPCPITNHLASCCHSSCCYRHVFHMNRCGQTEMIKLNNLVISKQLASSTYICSLAVVHRKYVMTTSPVSGRFFDG